MIFADLLAGTPVFVDANTLVYHFSLHPRYGAACTQLLERVARQELVAFTSTHVLSDATHRCMTLEAIAQFGWQYAGIAQRLKKHPAKVQTLTHFRRVIDEVPNFGFRILTADWHILSLAATLASNMVCSPMMDCFSPSCGNTGSATWPATTATSTASLS
jgi:hypothetical protein